MKPALPKPLVKPVPTNLTAEEEYRLTGSISGDNLVKALDALLTVEKIDDVIGGLGDITSQLPDEGFLDEAIDLIRNVIRNTRSKDVKSALGYVAEKLDDLQGTQHRATEYALDVANKLKEGWGNEV